MKEQMTEARLAEIKARAEAATPGSWKDDRRLDGVPTVHNGNARVCDTFRTDGQSVLDAEFIAHSRTDIPDLLAEVERLTRELEAAVPNRVLTLEEVRDRGGCPVWCEDRDGSGVWALVDNGEDKCFDADYGDWEFYCYGWTNERGWRAWTGKPSDEERKAVRWEDD